MTYHHTGGKFGGKKVWWQICRIRISHGEKKAGAVLGEFLGFPETPSEIVRAPAIRLGDKNYKELLYILYYIIAFSIG